MYLYTPDDIDRSRAHHQAVKQDADEVPTKRRGNLGELAFEQFCREYLPVEMWEWENEDALRKCNPESFSAYDFEVFGYEIDVKTSRDVSAFRPSKLLDQDPDDEIIVMVWHRDNEDGLILLGSGSKPSNRKLPPRTRTRETNRRNWTTSRLGP